MTEQQAKHTRKLNQAIRDARDVMLDGYTLDDLENDLNWLKLFRSSNDTVSEKRISTRMIAGLLKWQIDNL